jgi:hypothetical protein
MNIDKLIDYAIPLVVGLFISVVCFSGLIKKNQEKDNRVKEFWGLVFGVLLMTGAILLMIFK